MSSVSLSPWQWYYPILKKHSLTELTIIFVGLFPRCFGICDWWLLEDWQIYVCAPNKQAQSFILSTAFLTIHHSRHKTKHNSRPLQVLAGESWLAEESMHWKMNLPNSILNRPFSILFTLITHFHTADVFPQEPTINTGCMCFVKNK